MVPGSTGKRFNWISPPWHCYNKSAMAKMRIVLQYKGHGNMANGAQALILGTELILKSIKIIYSTLFLVKYMYSKWGTKTLYPKWGTHLGYNIGCSNELNI